MATERLIIGNTSAADVGRLAQRRGDDGEKHVAGMCHIYEREGSAIIRKLNAPTRGGARNRVITGRAETDFGGQLCPSGRAVAMEVKTTGEGEASLEFGKRGIRPEQVEALAARGRGGALSVMLWYRGFTLGVCSWKQVEGFSLLRKSLPATAFHWLTPINFDWLPVAIAIDGTEATR